MNVTLVSLAAFGVGFTGFLSYRLAKNLPIPCFVFTENSCQRFRSSGYAMFLGIPNPYLGLPGFAVLFVMVVAHGLGAIPFWPIALVVGVFVLFSLYLLYAQAFVVNGWCNWPVTMIATSFGMGIAVVARYIS
jgi:uncharacterized membrane protein